MKFMEIVLEFSYAFIGLSLYKIRKMFSMYVVWKNKLLQNYQNEHASSVAYSILSIILVREIHCVRKCIKAFMSNTLAFTQLHKKYSLKVLKLAFCVSFHI